MLPSFRFHNHFAGREKTMRRIGWHLSVWTFLGVLLPVYSAHAAVIVNPGFELPVITHPDSFQFYYSGDPALPGWTITGNSVDVLRTPRWQPHEGAQSLDLTGVSAGGVYQDINTEPGKSYRLSFWLAGNPEFAGGTGGPPVKTMKLSWAGSDVATLEFDTTGKTNDNLGWTQHSFDLNATGTSSRLWFQSTTSGIAGPMIDDLNLIELGQPPAVPLPAAAVLGAIGTLFIGLARRRFLRLR
jgi:choice-of-anchor C domain-containing protein